jgi:lipoprotein-anchoring transpeptidase ErfK/SrfK
MLKVFKKPTGRAFAKMPPKQFGDTWLPVIDRQAEWVRVLLPSRPNGASGWLRKSGVELRTSPYLLRVHLGSRTLDINYQGDSIGTWPVAVGKPGTPTPTGRTFLLGSVVDDDQSYSPVILPLGAHSDSLDTYGGGPGTVAFHTWPDPSVFGQAVSHGCIRVPADALSRLTNLPLGTQVSIDNR